MENGLYVPILSGKKLLYEPKVQFVCQRYIGGFATNERGRIYVDSVEWSQARFSREDLKRLPNLSAAFQAVSKAYNAGDIAPPHIQNPDALELENAGIFGWYAKTENGVIGIIRVTWQYVSNRRYSLYDYDDAYYIIEYGSDECCPIDRDALLERIGEYEKTYIFTDEYDEYGKVVYLPMA